MVASDRLSGPTTTRLPPSTEPAQTTEIAASVAETTNMVLIVARHSSCPSTPGPWQVSSLPSHAQASQDLTTRTRLRPHPVRPRNAQRRENEPEVGTTVPGTAIRELASAFAIPQSPSVLAH